jgi:hypothetical protein
MSASPRFKVYDAQGVYQSACKEPEAAAALVSFYGEGATVRDGHSHIVWVEGEDGNAGDSYDDTATRILHVSNTRMSLRR